jgi:hypothetical protein
MENYKLTEGEIELIKAGSEYIGERHGRYQANIELVAKASKWGLSVEVIAELTPFTVGEVNNILNKIGNNEHDTKHGKSLSYGEQSH